MHYPTITEILHRAPLGTTLVVRGWVRTRRDAKGLSFVQVSDGSCLEGLQVVAENTLENYESEVLKLTTGSSIEVEGTLVESQGKGQAFELRAQSLRAHGLAPPDYPLQKKRHSFEFLREIAHLRPRTNALGAVARIRSFVSFAIHRFFQDRGFVYVHTPIITASDCEGAGEMFKVTALDMADPPRTGDGMVDYTADFFSAPAYLTVSGQLEAESYACALSKVYTFGPTFRAENSNTARHLAEFWMVEPEMAFCELAEDMDLAEAFVRFLVSEVLEKCGNDLDVFDRHVAPGLRDRLRGIADAEFERISYTDVAALLAKHNDRFTYPVTWGSDLQSEHEKFLTEEAFGKPVIVHDYPREIKAFYMRLNDDGATVGAMDLLVPGIGELVGGSSREDREDVLRRRIREAGLDENAYRWYLELRRFGGVPHAGFGLGLERLMLLLTGMKNIRDVIPFPRHPGNASF